MDKEVVMRMELKLATLFVLCPLVFFFLPFLEFFFSPYK